MWLCLNNGFLSVVKNTFSKDYSDEFVVRSRDKNHLLFYFPDKKISSYDGTDYQFRIYISKLELKIVINQYVDDIDYSNFKNSVKDPILKKIYHDFWTICWAIFHKHYKFRKL